MKQLMVLSCWLIVSIHGMEQQSSSLTPPGIQMDKGTRFRFITPECAITTGFIGTAIASGLTGAALTYFCCTPSLLMAGVIGGSACTAVGMCWQLPIEGMEKRQKRQAESDGPSGGSK